MAGSWRGQPLGPHLEFACLGHVLDAFERFVFLAVHVQPIYLQAFGTKEEGEQSVTESPYCIIRYHGAGMRHAEATFACEPGRPTMISTEHHQRPHIFIKAKSAT